MKTKIFFIGGCVIVFLIGLSFISDLFYTNGILNTIYDSTSIKKIIITKTVAENPYNPNSDKYFEISDSLRLNKINHEFSHCKEISPKARNIHSELLNIVLFKKNKKINISALKTTYSGWIIVIGNVSFKNDSLISLLNE